jgi:3-hydroxybutyryl-CoA dehydratase
MSTWTYDTLSVGQQAVFAKTVSESDVYGFAGITGDFNPAHVNAEYASGTKFEKRIAHGMLSAGFISAVLGMQLPGPGSIYVSQQFRFMRPVFIGDTVTARVEIIEKREEKKRIRVRTWCTNQSGETVLDGEAVLMPPKD